MVCGPDIKIYCDCLKCDGGGNKKRPPSPPTGPSGGGGSETVIPGDPNEKIGPAGCGL